MKWSWKKVAELGTGVASMFVPGLQTAIQVVEANYKNLTGPEKREAAKNIAKAVVAAADSTGAVDLNDDKIVEATDGFVDATVAAENAIAAAMAAKAKLVEAIRTARGATTTPTLPPAPASN